MPSDDTGFAGWIWIKVNDNTGGTADNIPFALVGPSSRLPGPDLPSATAARTTVLWRIVENAELKDIKSIGKYRLQPGGIGKYFFPTRAQAENLATLYEKAGIGGLYTVTSGNLETGLLSGADAIEPAGEGAAYFLQKSLSGQSQML